MENNLSEEEKCKKITFVRKYAQQVIQQNSVIFYDFIEALTNIPSAQYAIVSSGHISYIKHILNKTSFKVDIILDIEDSLSKKTKVLSVAKRWQVDINQCYYITDTESDVIELCETIPIKQILGCDWGVSRAERLKKHLPEEQILYTYSDILTKVL